ncbi:methyltransferase domain-containing protein [Nordella sp. HKS 07]|uniref:methyltransferase domain-containing protein n=1 Tax=Nordella sp. HKS 07 TaxID=2712222 RepID=UPI0013E162FA|nr:methyltransferase domain-containing protein [Nordella sp. HKS 07]QIG48825.1 methyltransferase domain-containing protein [Nordella sp. HKS 07]
MPGDTELEFTGERYVPAIGGNIFLEHMHRYFLAERIAKGKDVLDIACGEGFGSNILARSAKSVVGVDISENAVTHATRKYASEKAYFRLGSVTKIPLKDHSVDMVVSFETIEHIAEHEEMMAEIKRVLRPGGLLIISTPDKATYTDASGNTNTFHVRELYRHEFDGLIRQYFAHVQMHGQRIGFGSVIAPETDSTSFFETKSETSETTLGLISPMYLIAVASDTAAAVTGFSGLFSQEIMASEPVQKRVEFEWTEWEKKAALKWAEWEKKAALKWDEREKKFEAKLNKLGKKSLINLIWRLIETRLFYTLSKSSFLSERARARYKRSAEKRDPLRLPLRPAPWLTQQLANYGIRVTAIVPNYNHAAFLPQRIESILNQSYSLIDILILDDCSTDGSRKVIDSYVKRYPERIRAVFNEENSGSVFKQWKKGHGLATGDLVWICESDDFCDNRFVEHLVNAFRDPSVMIAFGRIEFADTTGQFMPGMDRYRESSEAGIWSDPLVRPAARWFGGGFGVKNVIANVGGSIWRRFPIEDAIWDNAASYRIMGDWYLYGALAAGGQIAYNPDAVSFFRVHCANTSGSSAQSTPEYYLEYAKLMTSLKHRWKIPDATFDKFVDSCRRVYQGRDVEGSFEELLRLWELRRVRRDAPHVLIGILGFSYGGGEIFPIHLANALRRQGVNVSILQMRDTHDHPNVRAMLNPAIPVYSAKTLSHMGVRNFIRTAQVSVVHSHFASVERFLIEEGGADVPYIATLHGSYEAMKISSSELGKWAARVDQFVYTADRNRQPFADLNLADEKFVKLPNAMPVDSTPFGKTREDLGIDEHTVVFTLVARGIDGKGWEESVQALRILQDRHPEQKVAVLAVGEGPATERAKVLADSDPSVHFLGYVPHVHGVYKLTDVALLPTRFPGESYPLCLIQAMQMGLPCVATDIGDIRSMVELEDGAAGEIIPYSSDDGAYLDALVASMEKMLDPKHRARLAANARKSAIRFDIDVLASRYRNLYDEIIARRCGPFKAKVARWLRIHGHAFSITLRSTTKNGEAKRKLR